MEVNRTIGEEIELGSIAVELGILTDEQLLAAIGRWVGQKDLLLKKILEQDYNVDPDDFELAQALLAERNKPGSTVAAAIDDTDGSQPNALTKSADRGRDHENEYGRFERIRQFAQGGLGLIYEGRDHELDRTVAIKELSEPQMADPWARERFFRESAITASLEHPSIVPVHGRGFRADGTPFYAMRFIQGKTLRQVADEYHANGSEDSSSKRMEFRKLIGYLVPVGQAIAYAHSKNVIHRDLKPSNVIVGQHGETMLIDWGLARRLDEGDLDVSTDRLQKAKSTGPDLTADGTVLGTLAYMSPEQARGDKSIGQETDVYGLGAILFFILTGAPPREAEAGSLKELACRGTFDEHKLRSKRVPRQLAAVCMKALSTLPGQRYSSADSFVAELENYLADEPVSALPESNWQKIRRWATAHQAIVTGGLASLFISLVAMGISLSVLSTKNESLRLSNLREQASAQESSQNAAVAKLNGEEAVRQRQRVLGILNTFLIDVERGLSNVPGGAAVQRNVLTTVLNKLGEISKEFADDQVSVSNAKALVELGDLFSRVGTKDIKLDLPRSNKGTLSPLEAAGEVYAEALGIAMRLTPPEGREPRRMIAMIKKKQVEVLRQTARTPEALVLLGESLAIRRNLLAESPESAEAALDVVLAVDYQGQIHLQDSDFPRARQAFDETRSILTRLSKESPNDAEIKRKLGIALSRIADLAVHEGDFDLATELYEQDLAISTELYQSRPDSITSKLDLCSSLDRIGNMAAKRGQLEKAMGVYLESRRLREELHAAEPTDMKSSRDLFISYMKGGDTRMLMKEVANAQADYEKALSLADELAQSDPQSAVARRFQSISADRLADIAIEQSQLDDALQYAKKSLTISLELVAKDPNDGQMQRDLYICYLKVAKVHLAKKEFQDCLNQLDLALNVVQPIYERQPESLRTTGDYSFVLLQRAEAYQRSGNAPAAIHEFETIMPLLESIVEANRQDAIVRRRLSNATTVLGRAFLADGQTTKARQAFERSRQMTTAMIDEGMQVEQMQIDLAEIDELIFAIVEKP